MRKFHLRPSSFAAKKPPQEEVKLSASDFIVDLTGMDANSIFPEDNAEDDDEVSLPR